ncbi:TerC family protein [Metabacillus fastidiosus]|uniref:TerC family protein n=1 Tax=Metabacillus fastidiosus TaxID=1458 RepID=A0ABU6NSL4_9BACI|nr:TerC family protein [Metabacillus fastidiosus]
MEILTLEFLTSLFTIIVIDLVLAGDNAILIGLASRNVPKHLQKKVILFGALGAVVIRIIATLLAVGLLALPGLRLVGGLILIMIAYKLLIEEEEHDMKPSDNFWGAIRTIIIADALMGLDNVLAVAGAAHGDFLLVIIGLFISIPAVMWGSTIILKLIQKFPVIIKIGSAILAWTAAKMIAAEILLHNIFSNTFIKYSFEIIVIIAVLFLGHLKQRKTEM